MDSRPCGEVDAAMQFARGMRTSLADDSSAQVSTTQTRADLPGHEGFAERRTPCRTTSPACGSDHQPRIHALTSRISLPSRRLRIRSRTVLILNANTFGVADAFHPDAVYRINVDNDGDAETDVAFSVVFGEPENGRQRATVYMATGPDARESEARRESDHHRCRGVVRTGAECRHVRPYTFFAGSRSDPFFVDFAGILAAFNWKDGKNFTDLKDVHPFPWTGSDTLAPYNAFGIVLELPTSELGPNPSLGIWGRASVRSNGTFNHVDRAGHPTIASFSTPTRPRKSTTGRSRLMTGNSSSTKPSRFWSTTAATRRNRRRR